MSGDDRRRHPRALPLSTAPVEVQIMGDDFLEVVEADDISVGGIGFTLPHGISAEKLNEVVELIVTLPGQRPFKARGTIRHRPQGHAWGRFGVEFEELDGALRALIAAYVDQMLSRGRSA